MIFLKSPGTDEENRLGRGVEKMVLREAVEKAKSGELTSPEKRMTVGEWIHYNATLAEEKLRGECERMVGVFEGEGGRALRTLEGVVCVE